ncbi:serine/arginine repetitive matrix protein 1-like [Rhipicephalus sanguineus]|uniref:serine/arginine repetitive matrix protein 1-like n=1 Tax=Rhipicephalus sanguineus TaxID=34632 RepID=UPI001893EDA1|nr:serine/arginine repetitive matrix protein 1-like [Rhipicephalus sanguineus]
MRDPVPSHECSPKCATCGEDHLMGDRTCKKRLKPLRRKRSKTSNTSTSHLPRGPGSTMTKKQLRCFSSEAEDLDVDWPGLPPASDSPRSKDQPLHGRSQSQSRSRSRSRSQSKSRSRSRSRTHTGSPSKPQQDPASHSSKGHKARAPGYPRSPRPEEGSVADCPGSATAAAFEASEWPTRIATAQNLALA